MNGPGNEETPDLAPPSPVEPLKYADFRWLVIGALISFVGSQVQNIALGFYVYQLTGDKAKLGFVFAFSSLPVLLFGPFVGAVADLWNKRASMHVCMVGMGVAAAYLGVAAQFHFLTYWQILAVSFLAGCLQTLEGPTRQSIVRHVVPLHVLPQAIPFQAMAFNLSRLVGPALGGVAAEYWGTTTCFYLNAVSFLALVASMFLIASDLSASHKQKEPIWDLAMEGIRYTLRNRALRTLFWMECATSMLGIWYVAEMPAFTTSTLHMGAAGLGIASSFIGFGGMAGLVTLAYVSHLPIRPVLNRWSMAGLAVGVLLLGFTRTAILAYPLLALTGFSGIMQFNTTNQLFQLMSPKNMQGRVLSMHFWALSGAGTVGTVIFGWIAQKTSLSIALWTGGGLLCIAAILAFIRQGDVVEVRIDADLTGAA